MSKAPTLSGPARLRRTSPTASFAGQQDTYLNVVGPAAILEHVSRCWASLFTERAVTYRLRNGLDHRKIQMAVVVQQMVFPQAAGVLFTADPVTANRKVASVEASFGLGEALVSGLVNPDVYQVRDGEVVAKAVATKLLATYASPAGGTQQLAIEPERQEQPALTDAQVVRLTQLGRRIEAHFGSPQDIEWCLADDEFQIVQSRPITTLFPIPDDGDRGNHVFVSVGHGQMMTDAMKPLGISMWQLTAAAPMHEAGGRLFVDVAQHLASPASRASLLEVMGEDDPLIRDALETVLERDDFIPLIPDEAERGAAPATRRPDPPETDPAIVAELMAHSQASIAALRRDIATKSGPALIDFILADIQELKRILFDPRSHQVFMSAMEATWWLNETLEAWLGEKNAADTLTQSVPDNVTSEMGLALLDVADVIRPHPDVVAFLQEVEGDEDLLDGLAELPGGREARDAIQVFLDRYGMRCVGEIDITRPRWGERPTTLIPVILGNIKNFQPGEANGGSNKAGKRPGRRNGTCWSACGCCRTETRKAAEAKQKIDRVRTFIGYREYPKYGMISRYFVYKQALLKEAERLEQADVLGKKEDIFYLTFQELHEVVRTNQVDDLLIHQRKEAFRSYQALTPPRVLTSDGEAVAGTYRRDDVPAGALVGLPVSAGTIEGRARVILDMADADLEAGDILVTALHRPQLDPLVRHDPGPGDRGGGPDDPRRSDRTGVRPTGRRGRGTCHPADPRRAADPGQRDGRVRRDPVLARPAGPTGSRISGCPARRRRRGRAGTAASRKCLLLPGGVLLGAATPGQPGIGSPAAFQLHDSAPGPPFGAEFQRRRSRGAFETPVLLKPGAGRFVVLARGVEGLARAAGEAGSDHRRGCAARYTGAMTSTADASGTGLGGTSEPVGVVPAGPAAATSGRAAARVRRDTTSRHATPPERNKQRVVILSGLSGAGKTAATKLFEDLGYTCMDNLPGELLPDLAELCRSIDSASRKSRSCSTSEPETRLWRWRRCGAPSRAAASGPSVIFLEARDEVLIRRFSETRHRHPLAGQPGHRQLDRRGAPPPGPGPCRTPTSSSTPRTCRSASSSERIFAHLEDTLDRPAAGLPADQLRVQVRHSARGGSGLRRPVHGEPVLRRQPQASVGPDAGGPRLRDEPADRPAVPRLPGRVPRSDRARLSKRRQDPPDHRHRLHRRLPPLDRHRRGVARLAGSVASARVAVFHRELERE